ncbi:MAG TPA: S8 family serine peptidase [Bdellovibrionales bacterium]|nr:S8 family serine peptidase [Bdellovibrionales bacterium]
MIRRLSCLGVLILALGTAGARADATIDPALENFINGQSLERSAQVIVMLDIPQNNLQRPYRYDRQRVIEYLQGLMTVATQNLQMSALTAGVTSQDVQIREAYWINLSLSATVTPQGVKSLARTSGVAAIYSNKKIIYPRPLNTTPEQVREKPRHYAQTGLDKVLQEHPGLDGKDILVGHIDTGVDGKHPALSGKIALFFDGKKIGTPTDADSHGTHTAGTILGGNHTDNFIGIAPGAKLISAGFLRNLDEVLRGMQWMLDPDGNPKTADAPRLVSNSWRVWHDSGMEVEALYRAVSSWEAAGIVPVFAGGNEGPRDKTLGHPSQHKDTVCVAATGPDDKIASFSSRGPGRYENKEIQKPDIAAPGVEIISALPGNRYGKLSGTSMATPQIAGAIALLLQINPKLTPPQIREIFKTTATPADGTPAGSWNKEYGFGRVNILKAVKLAARFTSGHPEPLRNPLTMMLQPSESELARIKPPAPALFSWD